MTWFVNQILLAIITDADHPQAGEWVLLTLCLVLVGLRVYVKLVRQHEKLQLSDYLLIASFIDAVGLITTDTMTFNLGAMDNSLYSVELSKVTMAHLCLKLWWHQRHIH